MVETLKIHKRKLLAGVILLLLFLGFKWFQNLNNSPEENTVLETKETREKSANVIVFGKWTPDVFREVLGTVQSDNEAVVKAELSGTIAQVYVNIGDSVKKGQLLARYDLSGDVTAINYQSSLNNLNATKLSVENSIKSAKTSVENAKRELAKTKLQQAQTTNQKQVNLGATSKSTETTFDIALDFLDRMLGATDQYSSQVVFGQTQVGGTNVILKNKTKSNVQNLLRELEKLRVQAVPVDVFVLDLFAKRRLDFGKKIQVALFDYDRLIINTVISDVFSDSARESIQQQLNTYRSKVDMEIVTLKANIESLKTSNRGVDITILSAENRVKSAKEQLALTRAQGEAQIIGVQNQANLAGASQSNLVLRASIAGIVSDRSVKIGDQVSFGTPLFTIVNQEVEKKVVAYLSQSEWEEVKNTEEVIIKIGGQEIISAEKFLSPRIDLQTQKVLAEFTIPAKDTLVGSLAKVFIPLGRGSENSNIIPFSAVSFEPDGAEILVLNSKNIAKRRKVIIGKVVVNNIEILGGIELGESVVEYYKRVLPEEKIVIEQDE